MYKVKVITAYDSKELGIRMKAFLNSGAEGVGGGEDGKSLLSNQVLSIQVTAPHDHLQDWTAFITYYE